jgi:uncharacterized membrane protein
VRRSAFAFVVVAVYLALTLPLAYILNIWQDEAYTLATTSRDVGYAFHQAVAFEQNAPLYFVILTIWRHFGASIFWLRLPSVGFVAGATALAPALARRYVPQIDARYVTLAAAWNPFIVWAAVEMRVYALVVCLSALLLLTFYDAFLSQRPAKAASAAYATLAVVSLYTQYYLGILIAAQGLTLVLYRRRALPGFGLCCAVAAVAFVPMLATVRAQVQSFNGGFAPPSLAGSFANLAGILTRYVLPPVAPHATVAYVAIAIALVLVAAATRKNFTPSGDAPILVTTAFAFAIFTVATYASGVRVLDRHAAMLYLPSILSVFAVLTFVRQPLGRRAVLGWLCIAIAASCVALVRTYSPMAKPGDWIRVAAYIRAHERPGEAIVVFEAENALPLAYYYSGSDRVVPIPHGVDFSRYDVTQFVIHNDRELENALPPASRIWMVTAGDCTSLNVNFGCNRLERYVLQHYRVDSTATFYGARVRLLSDLATSSKKAT